MSEISIYTLQTETINEFHLSRALELVPEWRRERLPKHSLADRINGAFSYLLLQKLVWDRFGLSDTAPFTYGEYGKPYFSQIGVFFSISHCKTAAAAAVSEKETGLDVMDKRKVKESIALRICSDRELEKFNLAQDKNAFLLELWCKKESLVKKSGTGFHKGFKTAETEGGERFYLFNGENYTVSAAIDPGDTVSLKEIQFSELI